MREVLNNLDKLPGLDEPIVVTCASGHRGSMVMASAQTVGLHQRAQPWRRHWRLEESRTAARYRLAARSSRRNQHPIVEDEALYTMLNDFLSNLPEGFYSIKSDKINELLVENPPLDH